MRTLSSTLLAAQKSGNMRPLWKCVFTHASPPSGQTSPYTYTMTRVKEIKEHDEQPYSQGAKIVLDNSDASLNAIDLRGYRATISYGATTSSGDEYSACSPLKVRHQNFDSTPFVLECELRCIGLVDLLAEDKASASVVPTDDAGADWDYTVKDWIDQIMTGGLSCYSHCGAYTPVWDSEDAIIDTFKPRDGFRIYLGGSRLAAVRRLLDYTKCIMRFEADGQPHIMLPTITGSSYGYEYKLNVSGEHPFFSKAYSVSAVIPNYIVVQTIPDAATAYAGTASVADKMGQFRAYYSLALDSDAQAASIAEAIRDKIVLNAQNGSALIEIMNVGAEVGDYVNVTDSRSSQNRAGNVATLRRHVKIKGKGNHGLFSLSFTFGGWMGVKDITNQLETYDDNYGQMGRLIVKDLYAEDISADNIYLTQDDIGDGATYGQVLLTHLNAGGLSISSSTTFAAGYDLTDETTYSRVLTTSLTAGKLVLADQIYVSGTYGLVLNTHLSSGRLQLTSDAQFVDGWWNKAGVLLDATSGIHIYGETGALTTSATGTAITAFADYSGTVAGTVLVTSGTHGLATGNYVHIRGTTSYNGKFPITKVSNDTFYITDTWVADDATGFVALVQAYVGSSGAITAGAGSVLLDVNGVSVKSGYLKFLNADGAETGRFIVDASGVKLESLLSQDIQLAPHSAMVNVVGSIEVSANILPTINNTSDLGASAGPMKFKDGHFAGTVNADEVSCTSWCKILSGATFGPFDDVGASDIWFNTSKTDGTTEAMNRILPNRAGHDTTGHAALGSTTYWWNAMYSSTYFYKAAPQSFDNGEDNMDDIELIKAIKIHPTNKDRRSGRPLLDIDSFPSGVKIREERDDKPGDFEEFFDMASMTGLQIGVTKQLIAKVEELERKVSLLVN